MPSSGMLRRVTLVRTDVWEERIPKNHQDAKNLRVMNNVSSNQQPKHAACFGCWLLLTLFLVR
jgi:hypothetical protein